MLVTSSYKVRTRPAVASVRWPIVLWSAQIFVTLPMLAYGTARSGTTTVATKRLSEEDVKLIDNILESADVQYPQPASDG